MTKQSPLVRSALIGVLTVALYWAVFGTPWVHGFMGRGSLANCGFLDRAFLVNLHKNEVDFACYYSAALAARWGYPMHNTGPYALLEPNVLRNIWKPEDGPHAKPENVYLYPALLAYLLIPLTYLHYSSAELIWNLSCIGAYAGGVYLFIRCVRLTGFRSWIWTACFIVFSLIWLPFQIAVQHGQVVPWIFFLLALCLWALMKHRDLLAGVSLGFAMALKLGPAVFVPFLLVRRQWRAAAVSVIVFLMLLCVGIEHNVRLFRWVLPHVRLGSTLLSNQCVNGVLSRAFTEQRERWITPEGYEEIQGAVMMASLIGVVAFGGVLFGAWRGSGGVRSSKVDPAIGGGSVANPPNRSTANYSHSPSWGDEDCESLLVSFVLVAMTLALFSPLSRVTEYTYAVWGAGLLLKRWFEYGKRRTLLYGVPLLSVLGFAVFDWGGRLHSLTQAEWAWWILVNATFIWGLILWSVLFVDIIGWKPLPRRERECTTQCH